MNFIKLNDIYRLIGILSNLMLLAKLFNLLIDCTITDVKPRPIERKPRPSKYISMACFFNVITFLVASLLHRKIVMVTFAFVSLFAIAQACFYKVCAVTFWAIIIGQLL
ncbi:hypothetical protein C0149_08890 [Moraxella catarrhalis]|nr:hypothetical protein [Moraxella catarrhalis]